MSHSCFSKRRSSLFELRSGRCEEKTPFCRGDNNKDFDFNACTEMKSVQSYKHEGRNGESAWCGRGTNSLALALKTNCRDERRIF